MSDTPDLGPAFRNWLRDVPDVPPNLLERIVQQTAATPQRRRWLWFLPRLRPTAGAPGPGEPSRAMPDDPTRGRTPAPLGGTITMFTATKFIGLAAATALVMSVALTLPRDASQEPLSADATGIDGPPVSPVHGTMYIINQVRSGESVDREIGTAHLGQGWLSKYDVDDERLAGVARSVHNVHALAGTPHGPRTVTMHLDNDGGSWVGGGYAWQDPDTLGMHYQQVLHGQGGYEGLDAIITLDQERLSDRLEVSGVIIQGGLPEMPDPAPAKFEYSE